MKIIIIFIVLIAVCCADSRTSTTSKKCKVKFDITTCLEQAANGMYCNVSERVSEWECKEYTSCFPGDALVGKETPNGMIPMEMKSLKTGDIIQTHVGPQKIITWLHRLDDVTAGFLHIETPQGALEITTKHLLFVHERDGFVPAEEVEIGQHLIWKDNTAKVTSIGFVLKDGIFAPLTQSAELMVNGFRVSSIAHYHDHDTAVAFTELFDYIPEFYMDDGKHWFGALAENVRDYIEYLLANFRPDISCHPEERVEGFKSADFYNQKSA